MHCLTVIKNLKKENIPLLLEQIKICEQMEQKKMRCYIFGREANNELSFLTFRFFAETSSYEEVYKQLSNVEIMEILLLKLEIWL